MNKKDFKYSIEVYEDCALIQGCLTAESLELVIKLCQDEGFDYLTSGNEEVRFKLIKKKVEDEEGFFGSPR